MLNKVQESKCKNSNNLRVVKYQFIFKFAMFDNYQVQKTIILL